MQQAPNTNTIQPAASAAPFNPLATVSGFFDTVWTKIADTEKAVLGPPVLDFLKWVVANPGSATNPVTALPQINALGAKLLAAQSTANSDIVKLVASALETTLASDISKAQAAVPGA